MKFIKSFGSHKVAVIFSGERIERIECNCSFSSPFFVLGYICGEKYTLVSGFSSLKGIENIKDATECMFEAACIFNADLNKEVLKSMGYVCCN